MTDFTRSDLVIGPDEGEETSTDMVIKARTAQLGGDFSIMHGEVRPNELLAPHTHHNEDQAVYLLNGSLEFEIGGKGGLRFSAGVGDWVLKPRGVSHGFWNTGDETVHYIELSGKDGFERFIDSRAEGIDNLVRTGEQELGMEIHVERIPGLMLKHKLKGLAGANVPTPRLPKLGGPFGSA